MLSSLDVSALLWDPTATDRESQKKLRAPVKDGQRIQARSSRYRHRLGEEFDLAQALIEARTAAGLSQSQLARRMKTSQSYIARLEGGKVRPSTDALERFAQATRTRLRIIFEPTHCAVSRRKATEPSSLSAVPVLHCFYL
jgi:ribosome-binding protein aMBF1 (putative translation factor)